MKVNLLQGSSDGQLKSPARMSQLSLTAVAMSQASQTLILNLVGCATIPEHVAVPKSGTFSEDVTVGTQVRIRKHDGTEMEVKVVEVTPTGLRGRDSFVLYKDMHSLAVLKRDYSSVGLALGIAAVIIGIILASESYNFGTASLVGD